MITLLISAQPSLAGRPRRSRYRATSSLIVATKALSSLDVGALGVYSPSLMLMGVLLLSLLLHLQQLWAWFVLPVVCMSTFYWGLLTGGNVQRCW